MIVIRCYQDSGAENMGILIADTNHDFNLSSAPPDQRDLLQGPFRHARSPELGHHEAIARRADFLFGRNS